MPSNKLPEFMSQAMTDGNEEETAAAKWMRKKRLMVWISAAWFGFILLYITQFFGWSNLFLMMPNEFGVFLIGITVPYAIIWLAVSYIERGNRFNTEAKLLRAYMNQLVYPEKGSSQTATALTEAIRAQVVDLQEVTKLATKQTEKIKEELGSRVEDFAKLVSVLDNYSSNTIVALTESVQVLVKNFELITSQAEGSTERFKTHIDDFSGVAASIGHQFGAIVDGLTPRMQEMQSLAHRIQTVSDENNLKLDKAGKELSEASDVLGGHGRHLEEVSQNAVQNYKEVAKHLHTLDKQSEEISRKFISQREEINVEVEKLLARTNAMGEGIAMQVRELGTVEENIVGKMRSIENSIAAQADTLSQKTDMAVDDLGQMTGLLEEKAGKLALIADDTIARTSQVVDNIDGKYMQLLDISTGIGENLSNLGKEFAERNKDVKALTAESFASFTDVLGVMKKNSDLLTEASSIVVTQSKVSEASLSQQQRHITASMNKIEEMKNEIRRQIDDFIKAAVAVDENASSAVQKLKSQMDEALKHSEKVVDKTRSLGETLHSQSVDFDSAANGALGKVSKIEDILNTHYKKLEEVSTIVKDRTSEIGQTLKTQTTLIDKTTERSTNTFNDILSSFETQSTLLNSVAQNTVGYVSDVVQALDEKAEAINLLFKHQENEFMDICGRISENTDAIGSTLKKQVATIEQSADRVFARMALLEEDVNKRAETVLANAGKSIEKLSEISTFIGKQNQEAETFVGAIGEKLQIVANSFRNSAADFTNTVKEIRDETDRSSGEISENCGRIASVQKELVVQTKNATNLLDTHIKNIDVALIKTKSQSEAIKETLDIQKENLTDVANIVSTQARLGEASLAQQYKYLSDAALEVSNKMTEINNKFKGNTDTIFETSDKLSYQFDVLADKLIKIGEDIFKNTKNSVKNIESVNMSLSQTSEALSASVSSTTQKVKSVVKDYEQHLSNFNTVTAEASTSVVEMNDMISRQSDKMLGISEGTKEVVEYFNTVLNATSEDLSKRANDAYDKVKGLGENLKNLSIQLEETTKNTTTHFTKSGDKFRATVNEIAVNAERISGDIRDSGEVFLKQSKVLLAATEDTMEKVNGVMGLLNDNSAAFVKRGDELVQKSYNFSELFSKQFGLLEDISAKSDAKLQDLVEGYESVRVDNFLKDAAVIVEKLESFAVDINRIYNPREEEELWKKYYGGDTSVFVRHLAKTMDKKQMSAIRKEFEKNLDFRTVVTKYMSDFEMLVGKARSNEKSGVLLSVLSGADVGKLYYILAKSLEKLQ